jgi:hypothetical protein
MIVAKQELQTRQDGWISATEGYTGTIDMRDIR